MKKILFILLTTLTVLFLFGAASASAASSGKCGDDLTYTLDDEGTLSISGTGAMKDYSSTFRAPWDSYRSSIKEAIIGDKVTTIGKYAFAGCSSLTSVTIPDKVTSIGENAFYGCSGLTSVTIGNSVTSIGGSAFYGCSNLDSLYINDLAAYLNTSYGSNDSNPMCYATKLYINNKRAVNVVIPDGVTAIPGYAFYCCDSIKSVTIPDSVTSIGNHAFA